MTYPKLLDWKNKNIPWKWVDVEEIHSLLDVREKQKFRRLYSRYYPNGPKPTDSEEVVCRNAIRCLAAILDKVS